MLSNAIAILTYPSPPPDKKEKSEKRKESETRTTHKVQRLGAIERSFFGGCEYF